MSWWRRFRFAWANAGHVLVADCLALNAKLAIVERERNYAWGELNKRASEFDRLPQVATMLRHRENAQLLLERDTETQRADTAEAKLRAAEERIRGLELTVAAQAGHASPLRAADDDLLIQPPAGR